MIIIRTILLLSYFVTICLSSNCACVHSLLLNGLEPINVNNKRSAYIDIMRLVSSRRAWKPGRSERRFGYQLRIEFVNCVHEIELPILRYKIQTIILQLFLIAKLNILFELSKIVFISNQIFHVYFLKQLKGKRIIYFQTEKSKKTSSMRWEKCSPTYTPVRLAPSARAILCVR